MSTVQRDAGEGPIEERLATIEHKIDCLYDAVAGLLHKHYDRTMPGIRNNYDDDDDDEKGGGGQTWQEILPRMTTKQHAVLQMLTRAASNQEIADRLQVSINTVKVHVRSIAKRFGVNRRAQIGLRAGRWLDELDGPVYEAMSGGLPLDWDEKFSEPDPVAILYR